MRKRVRVHDLHQKYRAMRERGLNVNAYLHNWVAVGVKCTLSGASATEVIDFLISYSYAQNRSNNGDCQMQLL